MLNISKWITSIYTQAIVMLFFNMAFGLYVLLIVHITSITANNAHDWHQDMFSKSTKNHTLSNGDVILCIKIEDQPSLIGNKENIQLIPTETGPLKDTFNHSLFKQLFWEEVGACDEGHIPIQTGHGRGIPARAASFTKKLNELQPPADGKTYEHAGYYTRGDFLGFQTTINVWNPNVAKTSEYSLSQLWLISSRDAENEPVNTIEAGWQVYQDLYKGDGPRLFVFWTADGYRKTGCYNLNCRGFVQVNRSYVLGGSISALDAVQFLVYQDQTTNNWWLMIENTNVGYWPASLVPDFLGGATEVACGGEVYYNEVAGAPHTETDMGSGIFPSATGANDVGRVAYHRNIQVVNRSFKLQDANNFTGLWEEAPSCYSVGPAFYGDSNWGTYFFFGGPGNNPSCP